MKNENESVLRSFFRGHQWESEKAKMYPNGPFEMAITSTGIADPAYCV